MTEERYRKNKNSLSESAQSSLKHSRVCIVGLGGLGGTVTEMLARTGVGTLVLVDGDVFETSNLNRQILCTEALVGHAKADAAKKRVQEINSTVEAISFKTFLDTGNEDQLLDKADLVMDCLDSIDDRFLLQDAAKKRGIPLISGAIAGTFGQVTTIFPEDTGLELVYGKPGSIQEKGGEAITGNLSYCALFVAAVQSSEAVKVLLGKGDLLRNRLLIADLMTASFETINLI